METISRKPFLVRMYERDMGRMDKGDAILLNNDFHRLTLLSTGNWNKFKDSNRSFHTWIKFSLLFGSSEAPFSEEDDTRRYF